MLRSWVHHHHHLQQQQQHKQQQQQIRHRPCNHHQSSFSVQAQTTTGCCHACPLLQKQCLQHLACQEPRPEQCQEPRPKQCNRMQCLQNLTCQKYHGSPIHHRRKNLRLPKLSPKNATAARRTTTCMAMRTAATEPTRCRCCQGHQLVRSVYRFRLYNGPIGDFGEVCRCISSGRNLCLISATCDESYGSVTSTSLMLCFVLFFSPQLIWPVLSSLFQFFSCLSCLI